VRGEGDDIQVEEIVRKRWNKKFLQCYSVSLILMAEHDLVCPVQPKSINRLYEGCTDEISLSVPSESSTSAGIFCSNFSSNNALSNLILVILRFARSIFTVNLSFSASTSDILRFKSRHFSWYRDSSGPVYGA
jgi:hypothetical protein